MPTTPAAQIPRARIGPGTQLNGIYEIERPIAAGGMGEVYKGRAIQTGDPVAIKLMLPELAENESALALFRKEASALHNLYHEAIVRYYVFTVEPTLQCPYLAMEFVEGESLSELLQRGPLPFDATRVLAQRLAGALEAAHQRGIIHRDVSPDNIIIPGGEVARAKIIDFGIARSTRLGGEGTVIGAGFAGKYNYVSPEQLGMFGGDVTAKSDIYSLGLVLVGALTGRPLDMGGSQVDVIEKRRNVPDLGAVDPRIRPLIQRMLQPNPADRPESMAAVAAWAHDFADAAPKASAGARRPAGDTAPPRRSGLTYAAVGALFALLLGAGGGYYYFLYPGPHPEPARPELPRLDPQRPEPQPQRPEPPAVPTPPPGPAALPPTDKIQRFVNQYDGGDCFFIVPVAVSETAASIEAYGATPLPFRAFDDAFKRVIGFEADIGLRQVTSAQCPAITFLGRLRASPDEPPYLRAGNVVRSGEALKGGVGSLVHKNIELLLVSEDGTVQNVSSQMVSDCVKGCSLEGASFEFNVPVHAGAEGQPKLLLAVSSADPLAGLKPDRPIAGDQFFPRVLVEAARKTQGFAAAAKYFKVQR